MQSKVNELLAHISNSHQQMARLLDAERQVAVRMSQIIHHLPDEEPDLNGVPGLIESSGQIHKSIVGYLNGLADLQEAMAETLGQVMKEIGDLDEE
ncbi:nucleoside-diphosphate sugar epimerase [Paenibacillus sp. JX-17]|uniref:Nucleoside-diphosphate sugar epimerase n=1 Tax=Paenibacillus lacisoli TaxID=3064525 RepID=A0ABT9CCK0_9BACL|nr:nucleoside-diphosphate sugar epimerase [Paenibacillus sp. JX-17]MDO7906994.1 nucleoside-diphosphate sugar epimerase [Paenibacillus sp. JX-17]